MPEQPIHFNDGEVYETTMGVWSRLVGERFLGWLHAPPNLRWLDVGCGNGALTEMIVQRAAPAETQGVDPSVPQLQFARARTGANGAEFLQGDALSLPFPADQFDIAVMGLVIFFLSDPSKGVAEMARVVRPGGTVAAYVWDMLSGGFPWEPIHTEMRVLGIPPLLPPRVDASQRDTLRELWADAGLNAIESYEITVERRFSSFEEFWSTTSQAASLQPSLAAMTPEGIRELQARVRSRLPTDIAGGVVYPARANAIRGDVPSSRPVRV